MTFSNPNTLNGNRFGASVAIAGKYAVVGAESNYVGGFNAGAVYVYDLTAAKFTTPVATINNPTPGSNEYFGSAVALAGSRLVIGARGADVNGMAYVHDLSLLPGNTATQTIANPVAGNGGTFGESVSIAGDTLVVGAPNSNSAGSGAGSAYVFDLASPTPTTAVHLLQHPNATANGNFGWAAALSGGRLAVAARATSGVPLDDAAFVYDLAGPAPTAVVQSVSNPTPEPFDSFGAAVALQDHFLLVGAPGVSEVNSGLGAAYLFSLSPPRVENVVINGGDPQRSRVTSLAVQFDQPVTVTGPPSVAFQLKRQADGAIVLVDAAVSGSTVTLSFTGGAIIAGLLQDGRYTLTVNAAGVAGTFGPLDGDGNGGGKEAIVDGRRIVSRQ